MRGQIHSAVVCAAAVVMGSLPATGVGATPTDGSVLPFPHVPGASVAKPRLQDSTMTRRAEPNRLPKGAPNILIILLKIPNTIQDHLAALDKVGGLAAFTASKRFDVGVDMGSPVSLDDFDRRPFRFEGRLGAVEVTVK